MMNKKLKEKIKDIIYVTLCYSIWIVPPILFGYYNGIGAGVLFGLVWTALVILVMYAWGEVSGANAWDRNEHLKGYW